MWVLYYLIIGLCLATISYVLQQGYIEKGVKVNLKYRAKVIGSYALMWPLGLLNDIMFFCKVNKLYGIRRLCALFMHLIKKGNTRRSNERRKS